MFYRIKQFMWAIVSKYKKIDQVYLDEYLNQNELEIFSMLSKIDKQHSIRVSKEALNILDNEMKVEKIRSNNFRKELAKAGLLHDIGKSEIPLNPCSKMLVVIIDKITKGKYKNRTDIKLFDSYYNHPTKGKNILLRSNEDFSEELLETVSSHHKDDKYAKMSENYILQIVKLADDRN